MRLVSAPRLDTKAFLPVMICAGTGAAGGARYGSGCLGAGVFEFVSVSNCCVQQLEAGNGAAVSMKHSAIQNLLKFPPIASSIEHNEEFRLNSVVRNPDPLIEDSCAQLKVTEPATKNCKALPRIADQHAQGLTIRLYPRTRSRDLLTRHGPAA